jgi:hypothetical protein
MGVTVSLVFASKYAPNAATFTVGALRVSTHTLLAGLAPSVEPGVASARNVGATRGVRR